MAPRSVRCGCATSTHPSLPGPGWKYIKPRLGGHLRQRPQHDRRPLVTVLRAHRLVPVRSRATRSWPTSTAATVATGSCSNRCSAVCPVASILRARRVHVVTSAAASALRSATIEPGLQSGFCCDTGGGWSTLMVAHESQLHPVPDGAHRRGGRHRRADRVRDPRCAARRHRRGRHGRRARIGCTRIALRSRLSDDSPTRAA